jgi:hypothetical protein
MKEFKAKYLPKTKYIFMTILAIVIVFTMSACNNTPEPEPSPTLPPTEAPTPPPPPPTDPPVTEPETEPEPDDPIDPDVAAYVAHMVFFIEAFEELMIVLDELIEILDYLETDEDFLDWIYYFEMIQEAVAISEEALIEDAPFAPADYFGAHILLTAAVSLVYDSMVAMDHALAAAILGDYDTFWIEVLEFAESFVAAEMLWDESVDTFLFSANLR